MFLLSYVHLEQLGYVAYKLKPFLKEKKKHALSLENAAAYQLGVSSYLEQILRASELNRVNVEEHLNSNQA